MIQSKKCQHVRQNLSNALCSQYDLTRLKEDRCYISRRECDSTKPLKFITYQYHPYGCQLQATCYPGQFYEDGAVGACNIDEDSYLKIQGGNQLTNLNVRQNLQMYPVQAPRVRGWFHPDIESELRCNLNDEFAACTSDAEKSYIPYQWEEFEKLCYNPQETKYIIPEDTFRRSYNDSRYHRAGADTRHDRLEPYRNGCLVSGDMNQQVFNRMLQPNKRCGPPMRSCGAPDYAL